MRPEYEMGKKEVKGLSFFSIEIFDKKLSSCEAYLNCLLDLDTSIRIMVNYLTFPRCHPIFVF